MSIGRSFVAVLAGAIAGGLVIALTEAATHAVVSGERTFAGAVLGYGLGALAGSAVAERIAGRPPAATVPLLLGILAGINVWSFRHPGWFVPTAVIALWLGWLVGSKARVGLRRFARTNRKISSMR